MKQPKRTLGQIADSYGLEVVNVQLEFQDGDSRRTESIRVVLPSTAEGAGRLFQDGWEQGGNPEALLLALRLAQVTELSTAWKRRNLRKLRIQRLKRDQWFRETAAATRHTGTPEDLIPKLIGKVSGSIEDLLAHARYSSPLRFVPVDYKSYAEFRSLLLDEIDDARILVDKKLKETSLPPGTAEAIQPRVSGQFLRQVFRHARTLDAEHASGFSDLAERAEVIMAEAARRVLGNPRTPFRARFDWVAVDRLLVDSVNALRTTQRRNSEPATDEIQSLINVRTNGTALDKAEAVRWVWRHLRDRSSLVENFLMDVDHALPYVTGHAYRHLYRQLRGHLNRTERRLFVLMYLQHVPMFGRQSPSFPLGGITLPFDPVLQGALSDPRMAGLVAVVIGQKQSVSGGVNVAKELEARFKAYLSFYRYWVELVRDKDRTERKERRVRAMLGRQSMQPIESVADKGVHNSTPGDDWVAVLRRVVGAGEIATILRKFGIEDERGVCEMRWNHGKSQKEISEAIGVSQQAISAKIRRVTARLVSRLQSEGVLPEGQEVRRRKWLPRV